MELVNFYLLYTLEELGRMVWVIFVLELFYHDLDFRKFQTSYFQSCILFYFCN
jgi:hypothetical protein